jgi:hypothetical protein
MMINVKHPHPPLPRGLLNNWLAKKILNKFLIKNPSLNKIETGGIGKCLEPG